MDTQVQRSNSQDPRRLRELVNRAELLAREHGLRSVLVGLSGFEGDLTFPAIVDYIESALRIDDAIFRLTRERVLLLLTDVDEAQAGSIVARLLDEYRERCPTTSEPSLGLGTFPVGPETADVSLKVVLPAVFASPPRPH
jgi:hypothetical protein